MKLWFKKEKPTRLVLQLPSNYMEQFREEKIRILPCRERGNYKFVDGSYVRVEDGERGSIHFDASAEQGFLEIEAGECSFAVYFESTNARIDRGMIETAREILGQIVKMDALARVGTDAALYNEELAYVKIWTNEVELHYFATTMNAEWSVNFAKAEDGAWMPSRTL